MRHDGIFKWLSILVISVWLTLFALIPHLFIIVSSFLSYEHNHSLHSSLTALHYIQAGYNALYLKVFLRSFKLAGMCTLLCLGIAYPFAYGLARVRSSYKPLLLSLVLVPFWTSSLIRTYAIIAILKTKGILNTLLLSFGIIQEPLQLLYTHTAVLIGLVYDLLPFMIIPLYTSFDKLNPHYINAARDLGANKMTIFMRVILPSTVSGILSGSLLVFLPAMSLFYIPEVLGGGKSLFVGNLIQRQFLTGHWGLGGALSTILLILLMTLLYLGQKIQRKPNQQKNF